MAVVVLTGGPQAVLVERAVMVGTTATIKKAVMVRTGSDDTKKQLWFNRQWW